MKQAQFYVNLLYHFMKNSINGGKVVSQHKSTKYQSPFNCTFVIQLAK